MQALVFVLDMMVNYPTKWSHVLTKFISLLWSVTYVTYWLAALRFPKKFVYFLPVVLTIINLTTLYYYISKIKDLSEQNPEIISKQIVFCFVAQ